MTRSIAAALIFASLFTSLFLIGKAGRFRVSTQDSGQQSQYVGPGTSG